MDRPCGNAGSVRQRPSRHGLHNCCWHQLVESNWHWIPSHSKASGKHNSEGNLSKLLLKQSREKLPEVSAWLSKGGMLNQLNAGGVCQYLVGKVSTFRFCGPQYQETCSWRIRGDCCGQTMSLYKHGKYALQLRGSFENRHCSCRGRSTFGTMCFPNKWSSPGVLNTLLLAGHRSSHQECNRISS